MSVHIHTIRDCCAKALMLFPAPLLLGWALEPAATNFELAQVSGRVTCADQPFNGEIYFMPDRQGSPMAMGAVKSDGSFQLYVNGYRDRRGAPPGTYRVVLYSRIRDKTRSRLDSKYQDSRTTDLSVDVRPDWNYIRFSIPGSPIRARSDTLGFSGDAGP